VVEEPLTFVDIKAGTRVSHRRLASRNPSERHAGDAPNPKPNRSAWKWLECSHTEMWVIRSSISLAQRGSNGVQARDREGGGEF